MGFLDNSTTNIVLDAVLTDLGRQLLSKNDGSFHISKFSFGDDDIDYNVIKNYGRIIGKEKIEKNSPVMEALTNENIAQKYRLITIPNDALFKLPNLSLSSGATNDIVSLSTTIAGSNNKSVLLQQSITGQTFQRDLIDESYELFVNNRFLEIDGASPVSIDEFQIARYFLPRNDGDVTNGSKISFTIRLKTISSTQFTTYGKTQDKNTIITYITVRGVNTGVSNQFEIDIQK